MSSEISMKDKEIEVVFVAPEDISSGEEKPMSEWSSLDDQHEAETENVKRSLYEKGLYSPGTGDICNDYVSMSDSTILKHPYYNYPAVLDPGIEKALLAPEPPVIYPDDGQKLYLDLCAEMNLCPVSMFHRGLLTPVNNVSYYGVDPRGVRAMAMALQNNDIVTCLNLTDNFLNDDACYHLGVLLKSNNTLQELILDGCRIGESGMLRLGEHLFLNRTLSFLSLARNELGDGGGVVFANHVYNGTSVKKVNLSKNSLGRETALALVEALEWKNPFTHIDLSWNSFAHVPSAMRMLDQLANSEFIQELDLSFNSFEGERIASSIYNLLSIPSLKVLDLSKNRLQGEAIGIIVGGLIHAKKLMTLNLSYNPMSPSDAYFTLQKMLRPRVKLQHLLMDSISVNKSFLTLLERVKNMKSRQHFTVSYGHVLRNWTVTPPDMRAILLKRADFLGHLNRRNRVDVAQYFLTLNKFYTSPVPVKTVVDKFSEDRIPLGENFIDELSHAFPGPKSKKTRSIDFSLIAEYMQRLWPDRKLPPTPPPEPEPEPEPEPPPPKKKGKKKNVTF